MQLTQLSEAEIEDRFFVTGRQPVAFLLAGMQKAGVHFSVQFGQEIFLTSILHVSVEDSRLVFDCSGSALVNRHYLQSARSVFMGRPDGIHIQFSVGEVAELIYAGAQAFSSALPERVLRLQRRESFRIETPKVRPLVFFGHLPDGSLLHLPVHDLSIGGLGLIAPIDLPLLPERGMVLSRCHCVLHSEDRQVFFNASVRHVTNVEGRNGQRHWRIGLQFADLSASDEIVLQRYIVQMERGRHELLT